MGPEAETMSPNKRGKLDDHVTVVTRFKLSKYICKMNKSSAQGQQEEVETAAGKPTQVKIELTPTSEGHMLHRISPKAEPEGCIII